MSIFLACLLILTHYQNLTIMKNFNFFLLTVIAVSLISCASSGYVNLNYPQEPAMVLPDGINNIAVVNRSLTKEEDKSNKTLESIATGEVVGSDKLASDDALKGIFDGIRNSHHLTVKMPSITRLEGTGTRVTPELLDWDQVRAICDETGADVLLVLENFDSNTDFTLNSAVEQIASVIRDGTPSGRIPRRARVNIKSYWRMYDPVSNTIIDQFQQNFYTEVDVLSNAIPFSSLSEVAYSSGMDYASRFLPSYYRVRRDMYKKGKGRDKNTFDAGWRRTEVANWNDAINIWTDIANDRSSKSAGRAAYNIAVAHEVLGNTDMALQWARKSYEDYGDKLGRDYAKVLLNRQRLEY
ncbi:hypothetical protein Musp01_15610 [Muricauda sp. NBRC 101325]|nr:hypothetical protein Musp01_15610 [Muricauda sp. NBRC 101325]